jgi:hypothetical protein
MAAIDLDAVMDAIANELEADGVTQRTYAWPADSISVPCAVVGYPTRLDFDASFQRASDEAVFPIWFIVGAVAEKAARKALSDVITGATGIKNSLDGNLAGAVQTARVTDCVIETIDVGGVPYLSARFDLEVLS